MIGGSYALNPHLFFRLGVGVGPPGYSSAINVCDWLRGLHLLRRTPDPNEFCFSSVVKALGKDVDLAALKSSTYTKNSL